MCKIILVLGGARSGKSSFAGNLAKKLSKKITYIATAQALDEEMLQRIKIHRKNRSKNWRTIEEPRDLGKIKKLLTKNESEACPKGGRSLPEGDKVILFECLTLLVSNLFCAGIKEKEITARINGFIRFLKKENKQAVIVSNEVGCGIVPDNAGARSFRDIQGRINQFVADLADEVYFVMAGIGVKIK